MDINNLILTAKLGAARKDAQVETCTIFAAALYDVLLGLGFHCEIFTAELKGMWAHSLVGVGGRFYDSKGEFSTKIHCERMRIRPSVTLEIQYTKDNRDWCELDEFALLHEFYVKKLKNAAKQQAKLEIA